MNICAGCGKEVKPGDLRYAAAEHRGIFWHADCRKQRHPDALQRIKDLSDEAASLNIALRKKLSGDN